MRLERRDCRRHQGAAHVERDAARLRGGVHTGLGRRTELAPCWRRPDSFCGAFAVVRGASPRASTLHTKPNCSMLPAGSRTQPLLSPSEPTTGASPPEVHVGLDVAGLSGKKPAIIVCHTGLEPQTSRQGPRQV